MAINNCPVSPRQLPLLRANAPLESKPPFKAPSHQLKHGFLQSRQYETPPVQMWHLLPKMWHSAVQQQKAKTLTTKLPPQKNRLHLFKEMYSIFPPFDTVKLPKAVQETARTCKTLKKLITANPTAKNSPCDFLQLLAFTPLKPQ